MLKFHTPVLGKWYLILICVFTITESNIISFCIMLSFWTANDATRLDYITLLTTDDEVGALDGLQFAGEAVQSSNGSLTLTYILCDFIAAQILTIEK